MMYRRLYIAGPMSGYPQYNIPAFDYMAAQLRKIVVEPRVNVQVVSPAELDDPAVRAAALASPDGRQLVGLANPPTWGDFLARDVKMIADDGIDGIVTLAQWEWSRGARLETFVGYLNGIPILTYGQTYDDRLLLWEHSRQTLISAWAGMDVEDLRKVFR